MSKTDECTFIWCQNIGSRFFRFVTKHACNKRANRITTPKTALALLRRSVENWSIVKVSIHLVDNVCTCWLWATSISLTVRLNGGSLGPVELPLLLTSKPWILHVVLLLDQVLCQYDRRLRQTNCHKHNNIQQQMLRHVAYLIYTWPSVPIVQCTNRGRSQSALAAARPTEIALLED